jgi:hypothetical protein
MKRLSLDFGRSDGQTVPGVACSLWSRLLGAGVVSGMLVLMAACSSAPAWPELPLAENVTRESIDELRARADARLNEALRECYQRFAVNDCRREAMTRHRELLHALRSQELRLNALDRAARQQRLAPLPDQQP